MVWNKKAKKKLEDMFKQRKTTDEMIVELGKSSGNIRYMIWKLGLVEKYGTRRNTYPRRYKAWSNHDDWLVWYYKNHTMMNNREIGEILERNKGQVANRFYQQGFSFKPPSGMVPVNLTGIGGGVCAEAK